MHWSEELFASLVANSILIVYIIQSQQLESISPKSLFVFTTASLGLLLNHFYSDTTIAMQTARFLDALQSLPPMVLAPMMVLLFLLTHSKATDKHVRKRDRSHHCSRETNPYQQQQQARLRMQPQRVPSRLQCHSESSVQGVPRRLQSQTESSVYNM